jgi:Type I restriction enzyme R protein N terminus (HSDR_N)
MMEEGASFNIPLNLPPVKLKLRKEEGMLKVWDSLRSKYVALTPEEYVRQHFTVWLLKERHYPKSLVNNEVALELNGMSRRCDTLIYNREGEPLMIVEYKAPTVAITQDVFDQVVRYNSVIRAKYIVVSNGLKHFCCATDYDHATYHFIPEIPDFNYLSEHFGIN